MAGTSDVNAPFTANMKMVDAFIKAEKSFDLIVIPEQDHSLRGNGQYILEAARRYFEEHLLLEKYSFR
ncbi:MAG: prolyl oligopeptidase family serine peptidase [Candidatus Aminicenantes bacterium]|nr:prolyl oligopeptidase family serine peptidase [Candidatus Aminicenantes bacterium]